VQALTDFFNGNDSAGLGVADRLINRRERLFVFILDFEGWSFEVEFLRLRHSPMKALI
jgi:hypothetical protein